MRRILLSLLLILSITGSCLAGPEIMLQACGTIPSVPVGTLFTDNFQRASLGANWTVTASGATMAIASNKLHCVGAVHTQDRAIYTGFTSGLQDWTITADMYPQTRASDSYGICIGKMSGEGARNGSGIYAQVSLRNTSPGLLALGTNLAAVVANKQQAAAGGNNDFTIGDHLLLTLTRAGVVYTASLTNVNTSVTTTCTWTSPLAYGMATTDTMDCIGNFGVWIVGGTVDITNFAVTSIAKTGSTIFVGDSITAGYFAGTQAGRFSDLVFNGSTKPWINHGNASAITADVVACLPEFALLKPSRAVIMVGGNDAYSGISTSVTDANYASIVAALKSAGASSVYHCMATPRNSTTITDLNSRISAAYTGTDTIIDTFTALKGAGIALAVANDCGDSVHLTSAGNTAVSNTIKAAGLP